MPETRAKTAGLVIL